MKKWDWLDWLRTNCCIRIPDDELAGTIKRAVGRRYLITYPGVTRVTQAKFSAKPRHPVYTIQHSKVDNAESTNRSPQKGIAT